MKQYVARFSSAPSSVGRARLFVKTFAAACGFAERDILDIEAAAGEAIANAVEHGHTKGGSFTVFCAYTNGALVIEIEDKGRGFPAWLNAQANPAALSPQVTQHGLRLRGFGIRIMYETMDYVSYQDGGRRVRLVKRLPSVRSDERTDEAGESQG